MKYLFAVPGIKLPGVPADYIQADGGEPVIPWFPAPVQNAFLGMDSWRLASHAKVLDQNIDPDILAERLRVQYPGLPKQLLDNYVLAICKAAANLPVGAICRCLVTPESAVLHVGGTDQAITLWSEQPISRSIL